MMKAYITDPYYWKSQSTTEMDFILKLGQNIYPFEVKGGLSRNLKSIQSYAEKFNPLYIVRTSLHNLRQDGEFINIPLYAISEIRQLFDQFD